MLQEVVSLVHTVYNTSIKIMIENISQLPSPFAFSVFQNIL